MNEALFKNYTTTSVLSGVDVEKFTAWSQRYFKKFILPHLPASRDAAILEVGCGYGRYTSFLTRELGYSKTIGVDISEEQINYAKTHYQLTNVYCADAVAYLKEHAAKYDAVILMDVLEHLELSFSIELLTLIRSSMKPGAVLIIQVPNGLSPMKPIFYGDVTHVRPFSVNSMSQILRMAGFSDFEHAALPPLADGIKGALKWLVWRLLINPTIYLFMLFSHGSAAGGIYSSNLLTLARKESKS